MPAVVLGGQGDRDRCRHPHERSFALSGHDQPPEPEFLESSADSRSDFGQAARDDATELSTPLDFDKRAQAERQ